MTETLIWQMWPQSSFTHWNISPNMWEQVEHVCVLHLFSHVRTYFSINKTETPLQNHNYWSNINYLIRYLTSCVWKLQPWWINGVNCPFNLWQVQAGGLVAMATVAPGSFLFIFLFFLVLNKLHNPGLTLSFTHHHHHHHLWRHAK